MSSVQLSGIASGFDWKAFLDKTMQLNRTPINRLQSEKAVNVSKLAAFDTFSSKLVDLQASVRALGSSSLFASRATTLGIPNSPWSASASDGTTAGSYTFAVSRLATTTQKVGVARIGTGIAPTSNVSGVTLATMGTASAVTAGVFTINGAKVTIATTDSLQGVFDKISAATGAVVTGSYDPVSDIIKLSSTAPITLGAANDTSNFLSATKLSANGTGTVSSSGALGTVNQFSPLANARLRTSITAVDGLGNGSFTLNGVAIAYNINSDSMASVLSKINASSAGVSAAYDAVNDRITLTNKKTGNTAIGFSEAAGGFLGAAGITAGTTVAGVDAQYTLNGGAMLTSASNTIDASSHGITGLSVTVNSLATDTVTVGSNTGAVRKAIDDFIAKYNALQAFVDDQTKIASAQGKVTTSLLSSNREIQSWASTFRTKTFESMAGGTGLISRLDNLGIDFVAGSSQLAVKDSAKLAAALRDKSSDVAAFFGASSTGFAAKLDSYATAVLGSGSLTNGLIDSQRKPLLNNDTSIEAQIARIERQLTSERSRLEAGFIAMELAHSRWQQISLQLTSAFSLK